MRGNKFTHSKASSKVKSNQGRALSGSENHVLLAARVSIHRESWLQTETRPGASFQLEHLVQHLLLFSSATPVVLSWCVLPWCVAGNAIRLLPLRSLRRQQQPLDSEPPESSFLPRQRRSRAAGTTGATTCQTAHPPPARATASPP